nr:hypothetical protein [Mycolicibacterium sediminis]
MTPTSVGLVLVEGVDAEGATMDGNAFDVHSFTTSEQAAEAVRRTEELAATRGVRLHSIGVTWSEDADVEASVLMKSLSDSGFDNVVPIRMPEATEALARGIAAVIGHETTAVCVIEPDTVIALIVHTGDGAVQTVFNHAIDSDESLIGWLSVVFAKADWQPEALVLVGSAGGFESIVGSLEDALGVSVFAPEEAQLALARGAALASAQSIDGPLDLGGDFAAFAAPSRVAETPRSRTSMGVTAVLVAGVLTFVVSASVALSMQLVPRDDSTSASPAAADVPQAPVAARANPSVLAPPVAVPPSPAALPPVAETVPVAETPPIVEAPPADVAPLPDRGYVPEAPATDQVPEYPVADAPAADPALAPPAYVPPAYAPPAYVPPVAAPPPAYVPPVQTKKPGILTRIRDKLRIGDGN